MRIENLGAGKRCENAAARLAEADMRGAMPPALKSITLLPIPTSRDSVHIGDSGRQLASLLPNAERGALFVGYGMPSDFTAEAEARGALVFDMRRDEKFLLENADLTAKGALGYILSRFDKAPSDLFIGISGYGRIGSLLAKHLLFLGARVRVYTSREDILLELCRCGIDSELTDYKSPICAEGLDALVNTAPCDMRGALGGRAEYPFRIIELASGANFRDISGVEYLPSLPERLYPESAAEAYFRAVMRYIWEARI